MNTSHGQSGHEATPSQSPVGSAAADSMSGSAPPASLTVRPACESDGAPLSFFFDTMLRKDYFMRRGQLADMLDSPYHQVYVAEIDAILVGVAITTRGTRLVNALVHPAYRGLGIGRELVRRSGATEIRAKLDMNGGDPRGFYTSLGFESTGHTNDKGNIEIMQARRRSAPLGRVGRRVSATG